MSRSAERSRIPIPVILISIDTLRADHLGCYGSQRPTPNIDALAASGTLFSAVSSPVPLTLPSHVSLLTSTYPLTHGIRDNGQRLTSDSVGLASLLKSRGYRTAAFVGGFVLDRRFGLTQGFDLYDSPFALHRHQGKDPGDIKRLGREVVAAATQWLTQNDRGPFFLFLHLYDLHTPYNVPDADRARFRGLSGYDLELAYVDDALGTFWKVLDERRLFGKALIVLTSDHGEGLGDHGEKTHGYFIYQSTLRVPLIIRWPTPTKDLMSRVDDPASLIDVAPTILGFLGISLPPEFQGRSLLSQVGGKGRNTSHEIYSESYYGYNHFGVSSLCSLRVGRHKYIEAPRPELYDLTADPGETRDIYKDQKALALSLKGRLLAIRSKYKSSPRTEAIRPEDLELLRSLGYASAGQAASHPPESGPDPKDRIEEYEQHGRALALVSDGRFAEANTLLDHLLAKDPGLVDVRMSLGLNKQRQEFHDQAIREFKLILEQNPANALAHFNLAVSYYALHQLTDATKELEASLIIAPYYTRAEEMLGTICAQKGEDGDAERHFTRILEIVPDEFVAHYNLGVLAAKQKRWGEAQQHLSTAVKLEPTNAEALNSMGSLYLYQGNLDNAVRAFGEAVRLAPKFAWARYNLGLALGKQGKPEEAKTQFREALAIDPNLSAARQALAHLEERKN